MTPPCVTPTARHQKLVFATSIVIYPARFAHVNTRVHDVLATQGDDEHANPLPSCHSHSQNERLRDDIFTNPAPLLVILGQPDETRQRACCTLYARRPSPFGRPGARRAAAAVCLAEQGK